MTTAPGDFLVSHDGDVIDRLIQFGTRSHWNHAALIIDADGTVIEALSTGLAESPASKYASRDTYHVAVALSEEDRREVVAFARSMLSRHARYGWLQIAAIVLRLLTGGRLVLKIDGTFICSELVARALGQGGVIWTRDPALMSPADLLVHAGTASVPMTVQKRTGVQR